MKFNNKKLIHHDQWVNSEDAGMLQHLQITQYNTTHINKMKGKNYMIISLNAKKE